MWVPEASGSFPEGLPEGYRVSFFYVGSGSFRKDSGSVAGRETGMSYLNQINVSDVTSVVIGRSRDMLSFQ